MIEFVSNLIINRNISAPFRLITFCQIRRVDVYV